MARPRHQQYTLQDQNPQIEQLPVQKLFGD